MERNDIFTILHLPAHELGLSFYLIRSSFIDISSEFGIVVCVSEAQEKIDPLHPN